MVNWSTFCDNSLKYLCMSIASPLRILLFNILILEFFPEKPTMR